MRRSLIPLFVAFLGAGCVASGSTPSALEGTPATVEYVFDGDSLEVTIDVRTEEVRLLGINAPEGDECFGDEAREALIDLLGDKEILLVRGSDDDMDRYGRLLRYVYVDGENLNRHMLAEGHAVMLQGDHRDNDGFVETGSLAADAGIGMWAPDACGPAPQSGAMIIAVEFDPPGPDDERLNEEYVTISNDGAKPLNLAGWTLRDESSQNRYVFKGLELKPDEDVTVRTGCGNDRSDTVYWCSDSPIWSNGGDTAILLDVHGNVVDWRSYASSK